MIHYKIPGKHLTKVFLLSIFTLHSCPGNAQQKSDRPNIVILLADDMGYGDLQCYGNPTIKTPNIDALASEGIRFTSFEAAPWCVPSRTELMTGCYKPRINFQGETGADGHGGIPDTTLTLAQGLRKAGYATGMAGKWHLGYDPKKYLPTNRGFDSWLGLPYSNDYKKPYVQTDVPLVMYRDTTVVEYPVNQDSLTVKYTAEAVRFIRQHSGGKQPFFFYLAYNMPHLPIHTTLEFFGKSGAGLYGDVVETIDWSVGQVLKTLREEGLSENTIVLFASDNGPWQNAPPRMFLIPKEREGSNWKIPLGNKPWNVGSSGPLRGYKHTTYEGGTRVPAMIRWPRHIKPRQVSDGLVANLDIFATFLEVGGARLPDYKIDGLNMIPFFTGKTNHSSRSEYGYFINECQGIRVGDWKLREVGGETELFNMQYDPDELYNQAKDNPKIVNRLRGRMNQLAKYAGTKVAGSGK